EGDQGTEASILFEQIPRGPYHQAGRIKIGPDNKLYLTVGDALNEHLAQQVDSLAGKIMPMNLVGSIPADNPFETSDESRYGHRNAQELARLTDGTLYAREHGNQANDEINLVKTGENYGWPLIEGTQEQEELISPEFTSGSDQTWAPSGMTQSEN